MQNNFLLKLKHWLTPTLAGRVLEKLREQLGLWHTIYRKPEQGSRLFQNRCGRILLVSLCQPNRVFLDVGAHIGSVIAGVRHRVPNAMVFAVEADPEKAQWLATTFQGVQVYNCAVGVEEGEVQFEIDINKPGFSAIASGHKKSGTIRSIQVPLHRIDTLYTGTLVVDVIKIDVEGMELAVLQGASDLIARDRPTIYFESALQTGAFGFTSAEIYDWLSQRQYQILVPNRVAHDGIPLSREGFVESHQYPQRTQNYFAIAAERRQEIRDRARNILGV